MMVETTCLGESNRESVREGDGWLLRAKREVKWELVLTLSFDADRRGEAKGRPLASRGS